MLARRIPSILPDLSFEEALEIFKNDKYKLEIINELDKDSIRGNITIISQNPYIFNMSIKSFMIYCER